MWLWASLFALSDSILSFSQPHILKSCINWSTFSGAVLLCTLVLPQFREGKLPDPKNLWTPFFNRHLRAPWLMTEAHVCKYLLSAWVHVSVNFCSWVTCHYQSSIFSPYALHLIFTFYSVSVSQYHVLPAIKVHLLERISLRYYLLIIFGIELNFSDV